MDALAHNPPRKILLIASAGIAAYKVAELVREFRKHDCDVQVVTTAGVSHFVGNATFQALSGHPVRDNLWDVKAEAAMGHIELARWADAIVVAPATADFVARLAHGLADDLASTLCLASDRPLWIAPAMNHLMWANAATQSNIAILRERGSLIIGPASGEQACGETGAGRMTEPAVIAQTVLGPGQGNAADGSLAGKRAVVTVGPTREALDPVRFLSNRSSGKQGFAVATALVAAGAQVTLIAGPVALQTPAGMRRVDVTTAHEMCQATLEACQTADLLVGTAAVADYRVAKPAAGKIKKTGETLTLELVRNPDILAAVRKARPHLFIVGFAAETEQLAANANQKLKSKKLDLIAANPVDDNRAFNTDDNELTLYWPGGARHLPRVDKALLAAALVDVVAEFFARQPQHPAS